MNGTIFSVTPASRDTPPMNTAPASNAITIPTDHCGMPKALWQVSPMELACTMHPMKPTPIIMATAKNPARNFPNRLGNACFI